jgi:hypothetical protein
MVLISSLVKNQPPMFCKTAGSSSRSHPNEEREAPLLRGNDHREWQLLEAFHRERAQGTQKIPNVGPDPESAFGSAKRSEAAKHVSE